MTTEAISLQSSGGYVAAGPVFQDPSFAFPINRCWWDPCGHFKGKGPTYLPSGSSWCGPENLAKGEVSLALIALVANLVGFDVGAPNSH